MTQHRDRLLPADSARRRRADRVPLLRRRLRARAHHGDAARGRQRDHVPRRAARRRSIRSSRRWNVGSPATIPFESMLAADGPRTASLREPSARVVLSDRRRATRTPPPSACALNFSDPLQLNRADVDARLLAGLGVAGQRAAASARRLPALRLARPRRVERRRLLRSVRADQDQPQGLRRSASATRNTLIFDEPRRLELDRRRQRRRATSTGCRSIRTSPSTSTVCTPPRASSTYTDVRAARSATWTTRRDSAGAIVGAGRLRRTVAVRRRSHGDLRSRLAAAARAFVDLAAQRGRLLAAAIRTSRSRTSTSAASATTTSITATRSATATTTRFPGPVAQRDRRAQFRQVDGRVEPAAAAVPPRRHAGLLCDLAAAGAVRRRARHQPRRAGGAPASSAMSAAQLDFRLTVLSALDLTLSAGAAAAFDHDGRSRGETMVSLEGPAVSTWLNIVHRAAAGAALSRGAGPDGQLQARATGRRSWQAMLWGVAAAVSALRLRRAGSRTAGCLAARAGALRRAGDRGDGQGGCSSSAC